MDVSILKLLVAEILCDLCTVIDAASFFVLEHFASVEFGGNTVHVLFVEFVTTFEHTFCHEVGFK